MKKIGKPEKGQLVIAKITKIYPNSAQAELIEYGLTGMIHVSEIVRRWVRSIKEFLKEGQVVVAKVIDSNGTISLSIKQVEKLDKERKLKEFKAEKRAEKLLSLVAKEAGMSFDKVWQEVGTRMQDEFGTVAAGFEAALKSPQIFEQKIGPKWAQKIIDIAKKSYTEKKYKIKIKLTITSFAPDGVDVIKKALSKVPGFEVKYISAPVYMIVGQGTNYKELRTAAEKRINEIVKAVKPAEVNWEIEI
jgi:translation initiation factor 2 subunit 1